MLREQKVAAVEAYLDGFKKRDFAGVPLAEDVIFGGPLMPNLSGRQTVLGFLNMILPSVKSVTSRQHIVEGDFVATMFDMETVNGTDHVVDWIRVEAGEIKSIHAFYYPQQLRSCSQRPWSPFAGGRFIVRQDFRRALQCA
jgi:hypothetical protein